MARQKTRVSCYQGRYHRTLGNIVEGTGNCKPKKFLLGTDLAAAEIANRLLEKLWDEVVAEHEAASRFMREMSNRLGDFNAIEGNLDTDRLRRPGPIPVWREESLQIAEAIRHGQRDIAVQVGADANDPVKYLERIAALRRTYSVIAFYPESPQLYSMGQGNLASRAKDLVVEAQESTSLAEVPLAAATGQMLYQALDAYGSFARQHNPNEAGEQEAKSTERLKKSHPDTPLEQFGISAMERMTAYWKSRPTVQRTGTPMAISTVVNHLKVARRFIRWIHRSDAFHWSKPVDADEALKISVARLRNKEEIAKLLEGPDHWSIPEMITIYHYATDLVRLWILLGLNCAFAQAEICSLRKTEIYWNEQPPVVKRIRQKSSVPGKFELWPETITAIRWFEGHHSSTEYAKGAFVMMSEDGNTLHRSRIANEWNRLLDKIQRDHPDFRRLSFKFLRKTAAQLAYDRSDGTLAAVFQARSKPVETDDLADVYTKRPFAKVAEVTRKIRTDLQPMFDAAPNAFAPSGSRESPNISLGTIEQIQKLAAAGNKPGDIAADLGISRQTVYRWIDRMPASTG